MKRFRVTYQWFTGSLEQTLVDMPPDWDAQKMCEHLRLLGGLASNDESNPGWIPYHMIWFVEEI